MVESQPGKVTTFDPSVTLTNFSAAPARDTLLFNENQLVLAKVQQPRPVQAVAVNSIGTEFPDYRNTSGELVYIDRSFHALSTPGKPSSSVKRIEIGFDQSVTSDKMIFWSTVFVDTTNVTIETSFDNLTWFDAGTINWVQVFDDTIEQFPGDNPPSGEFVYTGTIDSGEVTARYWRIVHTSFKLDDVTEVEIIPVVDPILEHWNSDGTQATTNAVEGEDYYHITYDKNDDVYYAIRFNADLFGAPPTLSDDFNSGSDVVFDPLRWSEDANNSFFRHNLPSGTLDYTDKSGPGQLETTYGLDGDFVLDIEFVALLNMEDSFSYFALESKDLSDSNQHMVSCLLGAYRDDNVDNAGSALFVNHPSDVGRFGLPSTLFWDRGSSYILNGTDYFSSAMNEDGTVFVMGSEVTPGPGSSQSPRIYIRRGVTFPHTSQIFLGAGSVNRGSFGFSVAASGDTVVVGSPTEGNAGVVSVYVFSGSRWNFRTTIEPPVEVTADARFGDTVRIAQGTIAISAPLDNSTETADGSVHIYVGSDNSWTPQQNIPNPVAVGGANFGINIQLHQDTLAVVNNVSPPDFYSFTRTAAVWTQEDTFQHPAVTPPAQRTPFGYRGNTMVVASPGEDLLYVFLRAGGVWSQDHTIPRTNLPTKDGHIGIDDAEDSLVVFSQVGLALRTSLYELDMGTFVFAQDFLSAEFPTISTGLGHRLHVVGDAESQLGGTLQRFAKSTVYKRNTTGVWETQELSSALDGNSTAHFGQAVATSSGISLVGAPFDNEHGTDVGAAYVFTVSGDFFWTEAQKLSSASLVAGDKFGWAVATDNEEIIVGAPNTNSDTGAAYVYEFNTLTSVWDQTAALTASDGAPGDLFGWSVAVAEDQIAIGAYKDTNAGGSEAGAVYMYSRSGGGWGNEQKLAASDAAAGDHFGYSVAMSSGTALIGAPDNEKAYTFTFSGSWTEEDTLEASDLGPNMFGWAVDVDGDQAVVGAPTNDVAGTNHGGAFAFTRSGAVWTEQQHLTPSDGTFDDMFGYSVGVGVNSIVVGSPFNTAVGTNGAAYAYDFSLGLWTEKRKITRENVRRLGISAGLHVDTIVLGADLAPAIPRWAGATMSYLDTTAGASFLSDFRINPSNFDFGVSGPTQIDIIFNSTDNVYQYKVNGLEVNPAASPGVPYVGDLASFTVSSLSGPLDGEGFSITIHHGEKAVENPTSISGSALQLERIGTNGYVRFREEGGSFTNLFVGNVETAYTHQTQIFADASGGEVDVAADNYNASGDTTVYESPVLSVVTINKSGDLEQVSGISDSDGFAIKRLDVINDFNGKYNQFLTPRTAIATNGLASGSGGEIYIKVNDRLLRYTKASLLIDLESGSGAATDTTGEISVTGITNFAYNGFSGGALTYIKFEQSLSGVFVKTINSTTLIATDLKAELDVALDDKPFAWNVSDLATLYYVDTQALKLYDLNETKAAFVNVTSDKQVLAAGTLETATITAQVLNVYGQPKSNKSMVFSVSAGDGALSPAVGCSDGTGQDTTNYTVGSAIGTATITVTVSDTAC